MPRTRRIACSTGARDLPPARVAVSPVHLLPLLGPGALHDHRSRCFRHAPAQPAMPKRQPEPTHPRRPAGGQRGDGQGVRRRPVPGTARCAAVRLGVGADRGGRRAGRSLLPGHPDRHHGRLPPPLHPPLVQGHPAGPDHAGRAGQHGAAGAGDQLGRRPPPPPRLHRQGGRPALAVAVRHHPGRGGPRFLPRPLRLDAPPATARTRRGSPPTCSPTPTSPGSTGSSPSGRP